ncbi:MAG: glycosyltransferase [Bacteroidia bacterium]|nr:glycosyltransferase [Bacteroidia bacterium]
MIKILIINSTLEQSGITNVIYNLCKYLNREIFEVHILTLSAESSNTRWNEFIQLKVNLHTLNLNRFEGLFMLKKKLRKAVAIINPDVIQTMSYRGSYYSFRFLEKYKKAVTLQGNIYDNYTDEYGKLIGGFFAFNEWRAFNKANLQILCSNSLKKFYSQNRDLKVIQNGADGAYFYVPLLLEKKTLRINLKLPASKNIFITVGSLNKRKDPLTIIKAFINSNRTSDSILIIVGEGPLMKTCVKNVQHSPQVIFTGNVKIVPDYYKAADVFISASYSEGLPNTVLEAGLCGIKCFLSDIPQHREIFDTTSDQATFFEKGKVEQLITLFNSFQVQSYPQSIKLNAKMMADQYGESYAALIQPKVIR